MKIILCMVFALLSFGMFAASMSWEDVYIVMGGDFSPHFRWYDLCGKVRVGGGSTEGPLIGYEDGEGFHLKQLDHKTTQMPVDNNVWVLAFYGDLLCQETIEQATRLELVYWYDTTEAGGVLVENPADFYLGFMSTGSNAYDGVDRFGWYHVSVDEDLEMTLLDAGIGLYGEPVRVGIGPIPEPSSAVLLLVGVAMLGLRRKNAGFVAAVLPLVRPVSARRGAAWDAHGDRADAVREGRVRLTPPRAPLVRFPALIRPFLWYNNDNGRIG